MKKFRAATTLQKKHPPPTPNLYKLIARENTIYSTFNNLSLRCFLRVLVPWAFSLRDEALNLKMKHKSPTVPVQVPTPYFSMGGTWDGTRDMRDGKNGTECLE